MIWRNGIQFQSLVESTAKAYWCCSGCLWWPDTLPKQFRFVFSFIWSPVCSCRWSVRLPPIWKSRHLCRSQHGRNSKMFYNIHMHALMFPADQHVLERRPTHVWGGSHGQLAGGRPPGGRVRDGLQPLSAWTHISTRLCGIHPLLPYDGE